MRSQISNVLNAFNDAVWAITPQKYHAIREFLIARAEGRPTEQYAATARPAPKIAGRIAVLPLDGCIAHHASMEMAMSGGTSAEAFGKAFDDAVANKDIGAIVIDCNSPGGTVEGVPELAKKIYGARGTKPIYAIANANMNSAAYWIASAADQVIATPSANVGSIGVFAVYTDTSKLEAELGIQRTVIAAGKYKAEASGVGPLTDDAARALQGRVDECYDMFAAAVATHRGVALKNVTNGFGEGRSISATQALAVGMVDRIASFDEVIAELAGKSASAGTIQFAAHTNTQLAAVTRVAVSGARLNAADLAHLLAAEPGRIEAVSDAASCPNCGADMADGKCTECDYVKPDAPSIPEVPEANARRGAPVVVASSLPAATPPAHQARSHSMPETTVLDPAQRAADARASLETERARVRDINAVCAQENIPNEHRDRWLASDIGIDAVSREILTMKRTQAAAHPIVRVGADRELEKPFASFGEQMVAVLQAGIPGGRRDPRLAHINNKIFAGAASGMNESVGSEGGFFVQPSLLPGVIEPVYQEDPILSRVTRVPIGSNSNGVKINVVDETARTTGNRWGGIQMYWLSEADQKTPSKPKMRQLVLDLKKLAGLAYMTDELMQDAPAAETLLTDAFQAELSFMLGAAVWKGLGGGQPLGFVNSGALVTVPIEAAQTIANTNLSIAVNTSKMLSRIPGALWDQVIWLYNQELLPSLVTATIGTNGAVPVFLGQGGISGKPYDTIWGRPAFPSEMAEAVGTPGDIVAVVPSQYIIADKGGAQQATSMHVRFIYDESVLRIVYRVDGAPLWVTSVTPYKGSNPRSPYVALAARS